MLKFGHRGRPGYPRYGCNALRSFEMALWSGADALELDVTRTRDGDLIVFTYDDPENLAGDNPSMVVEEATYRELSDYDAGFGETIPRLETVLRLFGNRCFLNLDLQREDVVTDVCRMIKIYVCATESIIVSAFDSDENEHFTSSSWDSLRVCQRFDINIALLATKKKIERIGEAGFVVAAEERGAMAIHPEYTAVTENLIGLARKAGLLVNTWTVNSPRDIARLKSMGVNGIMSDFPELL